MVAEIVTAGNHHSMCGTMNQSPLQIWTQAFYTSANKSGFPHETDPEFHHIDWDGLVSEF